VRQGIYVRVADPNAIHARAVQAGAEIVIPLTDMDYGSREFSLRDPDGHLWGFGTYDMGAQGEPSLWPEALYRDATAACAWLERALGFRRSFTTPGPAGEIRHAELRLGSAVFMVAPAAADGQGLRQFISLKFDEADALFGKATAAGATVVREPHDTPYGARACGVRDPGGFLWWISNYTPRP
jgi:uncharacterized glyoxalase superfamily protein PhnB